MTIARSCSTIETIINISTALIMSVCLLGGELLRGFVSFYGFQWISIPIITHYSLPTVFLLLPHLYCGLYLAILVVDDLVLIIGLV